MRSVFDKYYNQRKVGPDENAERYAEPYSKEKADVIAELRRRGASGGVINQAIAEQKSAVEAERAATRLNLDRQREDRRDRVEDRRDEEGRRRSEVENRRLGLLERRVDNAGKNNRVEDQITRAEQALSTARARIERGFREPTMEEKITPQKLAQYQAERTRFIDNHPDVKRQSERLERLYSGDSTQQPKKEDPKAEKPGNPPKISDVQGAPTGSSIGSFVKDKGWEIKDKNNKVIGHVKPQAAASKPAVAAPSKDYSNLWK
jgi:hypothetical protein